MKVGVAESEGLIFVGLHVIMAIMELGGSHDYEDVFLPCRLFL